MNRRTGRLLWRVAAALLWALSQMACNPSFGQAPPISHADASIQSEGLAAQPSFAIPDTHQLDNGHGPHVVRMRAPDSLNTPLVAATPHLSYYGGRVVSNMQVIQVIWGQGSFLPQVTSLATPSMATFYQSILNSPYVDWLSEYNTVGLLSPTSSTSNQIIGRGTFGGQYVISPITNTGTLIDDDDIQSELTAQIDQGNLPAPFTDAAGNPNTYYAIFFPHGTTITMAGAGGGTGKSTSCTNFCAYHSTVGAPKFLRELFYSVHPDMQAGSGCESVCGGAAEPFDNYTSAASHEMVETITDAEVGLPATPGSPFASLAWFDTTMDQFQEQYGEAADICNQDQAPVVGADGQSYTVQQIWSNAQGQCVVAAPLQPNDFSVAPETTSVSMHPGDSATVSINTVAAANSPTAVALTVSGQPASLAVSLSSASITSGQGTTLNISVPVNAVIGVRYLLTITGTAGTFVHTASVSVTILPQTGDFSIAASPTSLSINAGDSGTVSFSTAPTNATPVTIALVASGAPAGVSVSIFPTNAISGQIATLSIAVGSSVAPGNYVLTVTGTSGVLSHGASVVLTVPPPPLTLAVTPSSLSFGIVRQFSLLTKTVTLRNVGTGAISLSKASVTPSGDTSSIAFTTLSLCPTTLAVGKSCTIYVLLAAVGLGSHSATLNIPNSAGGSPQTVPISASVTKSGQ